MAEKPTTVRFKPDINAEIRAVAEELGISFNAALSVLVVEGLKTRGRRPGPHTDQQHPEGRTHHKG